jgi:uncharacterized membrane-anchored protein YhcB (DUF1043 family)/FtsZ-binding cell division protein ZapB
MRNLQITILYLFLAIGASAQNFSDSTIIVLQQEIKALKSANKRLNGELASQKKQLQTFSESVNTELETNKANIQVIGDSLGIKIATNEQTAQTKIADVTESVGKKSLFAGIGGIVLLLLSVVLFLWLYRRQKSNSADIIEQLEKTKSSIDEKLVAEFAKQADVMESLLKTLRELPVTTSANGASDHSLALKLADEITLMERNIGHMDANTKGLKQLNKSIGKLKDNLAANGYEIPELLGKPFNEGMKAIITNSVPDENLEKGVEIITKIIKPQVNYNDKMIQAAQIEVSVGY